MKRNIVLAIIFASIFLGSCTTITGTPTVDDLGTINYLDRDSADRLGDINLELVNAEIDNSALTIGLTYDSIANSTHIVFTSNKITPEGWFDTSTPKSFIYQDTNSEQLYRIKVNLSALSIPENPYTTLDRITDELKNKTTAYNTTIVMLDDMTVNYTYLDGVYVNLSVNYSGLCILRDNLTRDIAVLQANANETIITIANMSGQLLGYTTFYEDMISYKDGFWHDGTYYSTISKLEGNNQQLMDDIGNTTLGAIVIIIFAMVLTWLIAKKDTIFKSHMLSDDELERETGYSPESASIDKRFLNFVKNKAKVLMPNHKTISAKTDKTMQAEKTENAEKAKNDTKKGGVSSKNTTASNRQEVIAVIVKELDKRGLLA